MIINSDHVVNKVLKENITVNNCCLVVKGITDGNIEVTGESMLIVSGIVNGDITITDTSKSTISGIVNGRVINFGETEISGIVNDSVMGSGNTIIKAGSIINGVKQLA